MVIQLDSVVPEVSTGSTAFSRACSMRSNGPANMPKVTNSPTARNATSLTIDSVAIASISPSWCSVASMWRVPNSTANTAMAMAIISARSPSAGWLRPMPSKSPSITSSEPDTALSCSAM